MTSASVTVQIRVTSVRSRGSFGGAIFAGKTDAGETYVVKADFRLLPDSSLVEPGQIWTVAGPTQLATYEARGVQRTEVQVLPESVELARPSGKHLIGWMAHSPDCEGIGEVLAGRLYDKFGTALVSLIESGDVSRLTEVVDQEAAEALVIAFAKHGLAKTLSWLDQLGLPRRLGTSIAQYWGQDARSKVEANPYVLVSFCSDWKIVDDIAKLRFGLTTDDTRRLVAATEECLYRGLDEGHTAMARSDLRDRLALLLGTRALADQAVSDATSRGLVVEAGKQLQTTGMAYIERQVCEGFLGLLEETGQGQNELFQAIVPQATFVRELLAEYEAAHDLVLTLEQRVAVERSATHRLSLILGGAGTGKTTVLKALCHVLELVDPNASIHLLALAGRAAQRMQQATGRAARTIAGFLHEPDVVAGSTVLIDESSMVDVLMMYRLLKVMPAGVRLVLIGDPAQLPPIGPGLVLHALEGTPLIPQTTLKTVKRQSAESGIPRVAQAVRDHVAPIWAKYAGMGGGVSVVACSDAQIEEIVAGVYKDLGGNASDNTVQVVSTTRAGAGGVKQLNALLHSLYATKQQPVRSHSDRFGTLNERTADGLSLFVGDLVMFGANDYELGLRNGSLGKVVDVPSAAPTDVASAVCAVEFEDVRYELTSSQLRELKHSYAITIHKSQGSQFERVIVPIRQSKLLDNALLYTAITRAVSQVVLVGNIAAAERAIKEASSSSQRVIQLQELLAIDALKRTQSSVQRHHHLPVECP